MADGYLNFDTKINEKGFNEGVGKLSKLGKSGLSIVSKAMTGAVVAVGTAAGAIIKSSLGVVANMEQQVGGVETLFKDSANTVIDNANRAYKTAGMSANNYMETVTSFSASLLQSLGGDTAKAASYADRAIVDMSDNANKMGTSMRDIQNAYQGFAKQNYTMLDNLKLGYGGTQEEMKRLVSDAAKLTDVQKELGVTVDANSLYTEQTITLPITLNAIPVASGGNVTIDGQQYIADRVVEKDGVFGVERNIREIHTNTKTMNNSEEYPGWNKVEGISDVTYYNERPVGTSRVLTFVANFTQSVLCQNNIKPNNIMFFRLDIIGYSQAELIAKAIDVDMYIRLQDAIFEPLPGDIQAKLRTLVTNYPVTNISVTSDQLDGYTVFNYPISMANGWNYVKQQLGDTRDYIYDMDAKAQDIDTQAAEAYVNSEYAVALTELEV